MNVRNQAPEDSRTARRFVPRESLTISVSGGSARPVNGNVLDISPMGARVATDHILDYRKSITLDVRCGYDFLFQAGARIVWQAKSPGRIDPFDCLQGLRFTELSPFSRGLIMRLAENDASLDVPTPGVASPLPQRITEDAESDSRVYISFRDNGEASLAKPSEKRFDLLSDPEMDALFAAEHEPIDLDALSENYQTLTGSLEQFDVTVVLQLLEATRATGVLYLDGGQANDSGEQRFGEIHFDDGRICGCFSLHGFDDDTFRWVVADRGHFRFVRAPVRSNLHGNRTTTALLLEWRLRRDETPSAEL